MVSQSFKSLTYLNKRSAALFCSRAERCTFIDLFYRGVKSLIKPFWFILTLPVTSEPVGGQSVDSTLYKWTSEFLVLCLCASYPEAWWRGICHETCWQLWSPATGSSLVGKSRDVQQREGDGSPETRGKTEEVKKEEHREGLESSDGAAVTCSHSER